MRRAKRADTGPEVLLRNALWASGLRYRVDCAPLPGVRARVDISHLGARVVVYVDGCFRHGCLEHLVWTKWSCSLWVDTMHRACEEPKMEVNKSQKHPRRRGTGKFQSTGVQLFLGKGRNCNEVRHRLAWWAMASRFGPSWRLAAK